MKISQVAATYHISKRTLRYYEEIGLLKSIRANERDERCYSNEQINQLEHILLLKKAGLALKDIQHLLILQDRDLLLDKLYERLGIIEEEIKVLASQKQLVEDMLYLHQNTVGNEVTFYELIKERIYLQHYLQTIEGMSRYMKDIIVLEFGEGLIQEVVGKDLPTKVGELKKNLHEILGKEVPLIRIRDNVDLNKRAYCITIKDIIITHEEVAEEVSAVEEMLQVLEKAIKDNIHNINN